MCVCVGSGGGAVQDYCSAIIPGPSQRCSHEPGGLWVLLVPTELPVLLHVVLLLLFSSPSFFPLAHIISSCSLYLNGLHSLSCPIFSFSLFISELSPMMSEEQTNKKIQIVSASIAQSPRGWFFFVGEGWNGALSSEQLDEHRREEEEEEEEEEGQLSS